MTQLDQLGIRYCSCSAWSQGWSWVVQQVAARFAGRDLYARDIIESGRAPWDSQLAEGTIKNS